MSQKEATIKTELHKENKESQHAILRFPYFQRMTKIYIYKREGDPHFVHLEKWGPPSRQSLCYI